MKPLGEVHEAPWLAVPSSVPFQFCYLSSWLLLSFSPLGALKFHQVGAGERAPGRSSASPVLTTFLANPPSSAWLVSASAALVRGADGDAEVAEG